MGLNRTITTLAGLRITLYACRLWFGDATECSDTYRNAFEDFSALSGATATYVGLPPGGAQGRDAAGHSFADERFRIRQLFEVADQLALGCWMREGRIWEVEALGRRISLCAPAACSQEEVEGTVVPYAMFERRALQPAGPARAWELSHWMRLELDFAIIGASYCGTTSIHMNLALHPEIQFTTLHEDGFFAPGGSRQTFVKYEGKRILPLHTVVLQLNAGWRAGRRLRGLNNPDIYDYDLGMLALSLVPNVRVIMVLCDPVGRFDKLFFHKYCESTGEANRGGTCRRSITEVPTWLKRGGSSGSGSRSYTSPRCVTHRGRRTTPSPNSWARSPSLHRPLFTATTPTGGRGPTCATTLLSFKL